LAAAIRERHPGAEITMNPSGGGRFEVSLDGRAIFEKSKLGRHAQPEEILRLIEAAPPK
jgi:selT/selW/selH-like putative selenoprotein